MMLTSPGSMDLPAAVCLSGVSLLACMVSTAFLAEFIMARVDSGITLPLNDKKYLIHANKNSYTYSNYYSNSNYNYSNN